MPDEILRMEVPEGYRVVPDDPVQLTDAGHYVSTYCLHSDHGSCRETCKTCAAPCRCWCHSEGASPPIEPVEVRDRARRLVDAIRRQRQPGHPVSPHVALAAGELREALDGKGGTDA